MIILSILSVSVISPSLINLPFRVFEVEMISPKSQPVTTVSKETVAVKLQAVVPVQRQIEPTHQPKKVATKVLRKRKMLPKLPKIGQMDPELKITAILGGRRRMDVIKDSSDYGAGEGVKPGLFSIEVSQHHPLFERVDTGEMWGQGREEKAFGKDPEKIEPSSRMAIEGVARPGGLSLEGKDLRKVNLADLSGEIGQTYYQLEGPAGIDRRVVYQELVSIPRWVEEKGKSLRGKLKFWVLPSGEVDRVLVEETFGYPEIDDLIARTFRRWRFSKADNESWGLVSIRIQLVKR